MSDYDSTAVWTSEERDWALGLARRVLAPNPDEPSAPGPDPSPAPDPVEQMDVVLSVDPLVKPLDQPEEEP